MAVIHISEADAARDLSSLIAKAKAGEEVLIEGGAVPLRLSLAEIPSESSLMPC